MNGFLLSLALRSAWNRRFALTFTVVSIALATLMLLGMERMRQELRSHFVSAVSGTDLVVGARGGQLPLLLYTLFHVGSPTNIMRWSSVEDIAAQPAVAWVVPIAKGDSHQGFPVVGTTEGYFQHVKFANRQALAFSQGGHWSETFDAVLGAEVAAQLGYGPGTKLTLAHGDGKLNALTHDDFQFSVSGILTRTGTPIDRSILINLQAMDALHRNWLPGMKMPTRPQPAAQQISAAPNVNAVLVGLERRAAVFSLQRYVNGYSAEPLMAILPGVALDELWGLIEPVESSLATMAWLVAAVSLAGLMSVILASLNERRRELAVLRSVGARPRDIVALVSLESLFITLTGLITGVVTLALLIVLAGPWLQANNGITITLSAPTVSEWMIMTALLVTSLVASLMPALRAYRRTLSDGLSPRA